MTDCLYDPGIKQRERKLREDIEREKKLKKATITQEKASVVVCQFKSRVDS